MADVENPISATNEGGDALIDDGEEAESKEIMLMKQRVAEMEKEAKKLRELQAQAAAEEANNAGGEDTVMETEEDKSMADSRSVYVGNVDYSATPEEIQGHFQACGTINRVTILCDKFTGHPRGYAYVEFAEPEHIDAALAMNDSLFRGRLIKLSARTSQVSTEAEVVVVAEVDIEEVSEDIKGIALMLGDAAGGGDGDSELNVKQREALLRLQAARPMSTAVRTRASNFKVPDYPFSKTAIIPAAPFSSPPKPLLQGKGLMQHLHKTLATPAKQEMFRTLFNRHSPTQIRPGSIIQLTLEHAPTTFTGVLMGIRRRGLDTSILLRNIIQRTGVEMQFFVNSPHVKDIKVLQTPPGGRMRRAKLFYLRDSPEKMSMIAGGRKLQYSPLPHVPDLNMPTRSRTLRTLAFGSSRRKTSSPEPPSPTFSDATNVSVMNFGPNGPEKIITRANLKAGLQAYEDLMNTSADYRAALMTMSKATAAFADALETCSGLKGPSYEAGTRLQAASGLHHLIGNHWHVLAETIEKSFERPLRQHLDTYRTIVQDRSASYERTVREKSQVIRDTEERSMNRKERNLQSFREALVVLQRQVDDLDSMKESHYREIIEHEEQVWEVVQGKTSVVVRSTMDVFDRFTAKASDPIIELMLQSVPDPFDSYGPPQAEDQIFSILAPLSIMTTQSQSSSPSPLTGTSELDASDTPDKITSWLPSAGNGTLYSSELTDWAGVPSPTSTPPRSVSPPNHVISRRHSSPPIVPRKAESKLRSVLSVIDESRTGTSHENDRPDFSLRAPPINGTSPPPDTGQHEQSEWASAYETLGSNTAEEDTATPRRSLSHTELPPDRIELPKDDDKALNNFTPTPT
ncbi:hypothetical protein DXG01_007886 [Tephrocybe rancida]|nr:hypothetical protein DXG01_007886 [Tephrocybe rancida]